MCCGEIEVGRCDICGEVKPLRRKYYHYDIKCDCHSPKHFEIVMHWLDCEGSDFMSFIRLDEAIEHCKEVASNKETCRDCANEHFQLMNWLIELKKLREFKSEIMGVIFK